MTREQVEAAALWFERHMPPMPGAREMYQAAVAALRTVERLQAEKDTLLERLKAYRQCEDCAHYGEFGHCVDGVICRDCPRDCYCRDCLDGSKWEHGALSCLQMKRLTKSVPAADVAPVVRCRECVFKQRTGRCVKTGGYVNDDDFCSHGRKGR